MVIMHTQCFFPECDPIHPIRLTEGEGIIQFPDDHSIYPPEGHCMWLIDVKDPKDAKVRTLWAK